jgi:chemotaxis protein MotA
MLIIVGAILVTLCVFGGFMLAGGNIMTVAEAAAVELFIIGGGAFGAFVVANSMKTLKASLSGVLGLLKPAKFQRADFIDVLKMLYEILQKIRKDGLMSIEDHVENPQNSAIFQKYPKVLEDHHLLDFTCDCLRLIVGGNLAPHELESLLELELETHHKEAHTPSHAIQVVADGLPAFGIVAAVLGIVKVMSIVGDAPPAVIGQKVASALVGTFLGILLGYGYVGPVANALAARADEDSKPYELVKMALIAYLRGYPPQVAIEFARKLLFSEVRPSFQDLEAELKAAKG